MIKLYVAFGLTNVCNARELDPNAEKDIKQFYGNSMYQVYEFKTQAEVDAFTLAVNEMEFHMCGHIVQKGEE